jgi:hypothetical protein
MSTAKLGASVLVILVLVLGATTLARAETVDCLAITALPTVITVQGIYCFTGHLTTNMTSGSAIDIQTNNMVLDLNGFNLIGLAGLGTQAVGIRALDRQNITIKNGTVRGFLRGIQLETGGNSEGHVVEGIRADQNTFVGIHVEGTGILVRDCQVVATGGATTRGANADAIGILASGLGLRVVENDVVDTTTQGTGTAVAIQFQTNTAGGLAEDNRITVADKGIEFLSGATGKCRGNLTFSVTTPFTGCTDLDSGPLAQTISFTSAALGAATVGGTPYTVTATATSGLPVSFTIDASASTVCTIAGATVSFIGVGTCVIDANQAGDATYSAAPQVQQSFAVGKSAQTITFTSTAPANATVGGATYTVMATGGGSGNPVTFTIDASASTVCMIAGATVSFIGAGTCVIDANQAGDATYSAAPQVQQSFAVGKNAQTITFTSTAPAGAKVGGATYTVMATGGGSGNPVTFTIDASASTVCTIAGTTVSFIGAGTCVIDANQAGDATYSAAPQVQQSFAVSKGDQTITFTSPATAGAKLGGATYTVMATGGGSGNPVTFTIDASASTVCTIAGTTVSFIGVGTCVIDANQAGNAKFNPAPQVQQSFAVAKGDQTITFISTAPAKVKPGQAYTVTATATSSLAVAFTIDVSSAGVCSIAGAAVSFLADGLCKINANQTGNANYNPAPQVQQSILVDAPPTVTSTTPTNGAINVPLTSTISITFSKSVNVTGSAFMLACSPGTAPGFMVTPASPATTYVLQHPTANLPFDSSCTVTVVASQVSSIALTPMAADAMFSFATPPIANADTYPETLIGNVSIDSSVISYSVTANDSFNSPITITAFDATSANGGTVSMTTSGAGIGQFTYNPAAGYTGADSFTYTISNANGSSTATVNLTLSGIIWFINNNAGAGDGRLSSPFNSLAAFQAVNDGVGNHPAANANIFLYDSATGYTGPVTLLNGQKLIGQDATSSLSTITGLTPGTSSAKLPETGGGSPNKVSITSAGNTVTLGSGNTVWGMTLGNATGTALTGSSVGTFQMADLAVNNTTGAGISLTGGGPVTATGTNTIATTSSTALNSTALNVKNTTIGASGLTFRSISSNGGSANGIILDTTGSSGGLTVTGNGGSCTSAATCTGGDLSSKTGADGSTTQGSGVFLNSTSNVSLAYMNIQGNQNYGIRGNNVTNFTLDHSVVGTTATNGMSNTADADATGYTGEGSVRFYNLLGSATISNSSLDQGFTKTIAIANDTGTLDRLTITNSTVKQSLTASTASDSFYAQSSSNATLNLTITGASQFTATHQFHVDTSAQGTSTMDIQINGGCVFSNSIDPSPAGGGLVFNGSGTDSLVTFNINGNSFRQGSAGHAPLSNVGRLLTVGTVSGSGKFDGKILNNTFGVTGVSFSGSGNGADAIGLFASGNHAGTTRVTGTTDSRFLVQGNTIKRYGEVGIQINARQGNSTLDATVLGNTINEPGAAAQGAFGAIWVNAGALAADTNTVNIAIGSTTAADKNTMQDSDPSNATDVFLDKNTCSSCASTLNLYRNGSSASGSGEALVKQILIDDNNATLDLTAGFTNSSTIGIQSGTPPAPL